MSEFVVEAKASLDDAGTRPIPRLIGPFQTREHAEIYMGLTYPRLWGSWNVAPMESPTDAAIEARR